MNTSHIFIVEDDALVVSHLQQILSNFNYQIAGIAASGAEALELINKTNPDLVLMDIRLRGSMNGLETAKEISEKHQIPIIFLTAYANTDYLSQAQIDEAYSYLLKPIRGVDLHTNIQMALFKHKLQKKLNLMNTVLRSRQNLNRMILKEKDQNKFLKEVLRTLFDSEVFSHTFLISGKDSSFNYCASLPHLPQIEKKFYRDVKKGKLPSCVNKALESDRVIICASANDECPDCPFFEIKSVESLMTYALKYQDQLYGVLSVSMHQEFASDPSFTELFKEIGDDIAFALYNFELENLQKQTQSALEQSEYKYRILSEYALTGVYLIQNGQFKYTNPKTAEIFGFDSVEEINRLESVLDLVSQENKLLFQKNMEDLLKKRINAMHFEFSGQRKNGEKVEVEIFGAPIPYKDNTAIIGTLIDITERKQNIETIRKLSKAMEQSPASILITDTEGNIEYVNPAFTKITGYTFEEVKGKNPRILNSGEMPPEVFEHLWKTVKNGKVWEGEIFNKKKNGETFWERIIISPITDDNNVITHFLAIEEDITEKKRLEKQLLQTQKMEAVGRLAGGIAHDFNNLLTVINGYSQLLLHTMPEDDPHRKKINQIYQAGEKAKNLTSQLLAFSRKQMRQPEIINLNKLVTDLQTMLQSLIGEDIEIKVELSEDLWQIESDKHQLEQILFNISVNARQAMPEGGEFTILTENCVLNKNFVTKHPGSNTGPHVMLSISDTGVGMDKETMKHIFEPFFTTKPVGQGTGLGLSMVYGIVKQNNGYIYVSSIPGKGSTFKIFFPAVETNEIAEDNATVTEDTDLFGNETILLVEDDPSVRSMTERSLSYFGYKVVVAQNGNEALKKIKSSKKPFDLIITDLIMPVMGGKKLFDIIKKYYPKIKVLFMSGYSEEGIVQDSEIEKGVHFLQKPFSPMELAQNVRKILEDKTA
ncbi:MAG: response regulator, partial [Calditrichaeota bacterium]|nr:response regulator [Calditrichota bacterium]